MFEYLLFFGDGVGLVEVGGEEYFVIVVVGEEVVEWVGEWFVVFVCEY